MVVYRAAC